jgi:hypothetical protein
MASKNQSRAIPAAIFLLAAGMFDCPGVMWSKSLICSPASAYIGTAVFPYGFSLMML